MKAVWVQSPSLSHRQWWLGVKSQLPIIMGVIPFGLIYGVVALAAGLTPVQAQAMSLIVFAGSAQFIGAELMGAGAPLPVIWLTTLVVNVRHTLYSTQLGPEVRHLPRRWRLLLAYLLTDEAFATTAVHYGRPGTPPGSRHWYFLGAGLALWLTWQMSTAVGIFLGAEIPARWGLDFALALTFIGIVIPLLVTRPMLTAAGIAGLVAVLTHGLPYNLGIILAGFSGIIAGVWSENRYHADE